tara:strand:- start:3695 stop:4180 length:486 start_codon:yes stop_codon:yes gene_type:complete
LSNKTAPIFLAPEEEATLHTLAATPGDNEKSERTRKRATIILQWAAGETIKSSAALMNVSESQISYSRHNYRKKGLKWFDPERRTTTDLAALADKALKSGNPVSVADVSALTLAHLSNMQETNGANAKVALDSLAVLLRCSQHLEPKKAGDIAAAIDEAMD